MESILNEAKKRDVGKRFDAVGQFGQNHIRVKGFQESSPRHENWSESGDLLTKINETPTVK